MVLNGVANQIFNNITVIGTTTPYDGFNVINGGANTPVSSLVESIENNKPSRIYISSTVINDTGRQENQLQLLYDLCSRLQIKLFVGGMAFNSLNYDHPIVEQRLFTFTEIAEI